MESVERVPLLGLGRCSPLENGHHKSKHYRVRVTGLAAALLAIRKPPGSVADLCSLQRKSAMLFGTGIALRRYRPYLPLRRNIRLMSTERAKVVPKGIGSTVENATKNPEGVALNSLQ